MGLGDNIIVNDFMFCTDHGREYCSSCFCDHRLCNNIRMEFDEKTTERFEDVLHSIDDRPVFNAFALGAKLADKKEETYKCSKHGTVDCGDCFDWEKLILKSLDMLERLNAAKSATGSAKRATKEVEKKMNIHDVD